MTKKTEEPTYENESFLTQEQIEEIREKGLKEVMETKHTWKQRGPWVVCTSCPQEHAFHIGTKKLLVGVDSGGMPKLIEL